VQAAGKCGLAALKHTLQPTEQVPVEQVPIDNVSTGRNANRTDGEAAGDISAAGDPLQPQQRILHCLPVKKLPGRSPPGSEQ